MRRACNVSYNNKRYDTNGLERQLRQLRYAHPFLPQQLYFVFLDLGINLRTTGRFMTLFLSRFKWVLDSL